MIKIYIQFSIPRLIKVNVKTTHIPTVQFHGLLVMVGVRDECRRIRAGIDRQSSVAAEIPRIEF